MPSRNAPSSKPATPDKSSHMSALTPVTELPTSGRSAKASHRRRSRSRRGDQAVPSWPGVHFLERTHVEVQVTVWRSTWHPALLPPQASPAPVLVVRDTRSALASLGGVRPPPFSPAAFSVTPNRALLNALLALTLDAVTPRAKPPPAARAPATG